MCTVRVNLEQCQDVHCDVEVTPILLVGCVPDLTTSYMVTNKDTVSPPRFFKHWGTPLKSTQYRQESVFYGTIELFIYDSGIAWLGEVAW